MENTIIDNTVENTTIQDTNILNTTDLKAIHTDLGIITSILIFFVLVILLRYAYKFLDIFF